MYRKTLPLPFAVLAILVFAFAGPFVASASTRIGNLYRDAPNGIAFIKDDAAAFVMDPGGSYNAGVVAPDDSYHEVLLPRQDHTPDSAVQFQWARVGDAIVARLRSQTPTKIVIRLDKNWPGFVSSFSATTNGVSGSAQTPAGLVTWQLQSKPAPQDVDASSITLRLAGPETPTYVVAGFGNLPSFDGIDRTLSDAEKIFERHRPRSIGPVGDILGAITNNLNNSRVYSTDNKMAPITVARTFSGPGANDAPYFGWDSFFNGLLASIDNPEAAQETIRAILSGQSPEGLVPNFTHGKFPEGRISTDRSEPPVGALCVWKMQLRHPDLGFLREVYPRLARWHAWWMNERNARHDGLLEWGSALGTLQGAQFETGWDDTPHFEGVPGVHMAGNTMNVYAVDLNALWAADAQYLALIAAALGENKDAGMYRRQAVEMNRRINAKLWNEELGIYCSRFWDNDDGTPGAFLARLTPANFYPLISGAPSAAQAKRVLAIMTDPTQFWGEWILPTVSRKDPFFFQQVYWHGTIWGPVNYLVFQGLKRYAPPALQAEFAQKSVHLFMNNWLGAGMCGENFLSLNGRVGGHPNYTWGALLALIGVESVVDIGDDGQPRSGPGFNEPVTFYNLPVQGKPLHVTLTYGIPRWSVERAH